MRETRAYIERHGRPITFYSDKHAIFRVNNREGMTQFGRALNELNIDILCANSPQAKGRVERSFGTLQDRLVKELRLGGISDVPGANAFLPGFVAQYNARFEKPPHSDENAHRPVSDAHPLEDVFAWKEERTLTKNLTVQYDKVLFLLEPNELTRSLARQCATIVDYPDGRIAIRHKGATCPTGLSTSCRRSIRRRLSRTNDSARCWRTSRRARSRGPRAVRRVRRAGKDRLIGTCSRSADPPRRRIMTCAASLRQAGKNPHEASRERRFGEDSVNTGGGRAVAALVGASRPRALIAAQRRGVPFQLCGESAISGLHRQRL